MRPRDLTRKFKCYQDFARLKQKPQSPLEKFNSNFFIPGQEKDYFFLRKIIPTETKGESNDHDG